MIDKIFVTYECGGKYFPSYNDAYFYGKHLPVQQKPRYVFTPTMQSFKRVCELENAFRRYCQKTTGCDYYDFFNHYGVIQEKLELEF